MKNINLHIAGTAAGKPVPRHNRYAYTVLNNMHFCFLVMEKDFKDFLGGLKVSEETATLVRAYDLAVASFKFFNGVELVVCGGENNEEFERVRKEVEAEAGEYQACLLNAISIAIADHGRTRSDVGGWI